MRTALVCISLLLTIGGALLIASVPRVPGGTPAAISSSPPALSAPELASSEASADADGPELVLDSLRTGSSAVSSEPRPVATLERAALALPAPSPTRAAVPAAAPSSASARLLFVGDVMLGRNIAPIRRARGNAYPFALVAPFIRAADLAFANLESPLTRQTFFRGGYNLRADPEAVEALSLAGFDWVSVANNHSGDHGRAGLAETLATLRGRGIAYAGGGITEAEAVRPAIKTVNGLRIALLAYDALHATITASGDQPGSRWFDGGRAAADVRRARADGAHIVIVSVHWGVEYQQSATAAQKQAARQLALAGADLIVGHHPHVVEPLEWLAQPNGRPSVVAYSLGNFLFDQWFGDAVREGAILNVVVDRTGVAAVNVMPTRNPSGQVLLQTSTAAATLKRLLPAGAVPAEWQRRAATDAQNRIWYRRQ